MTQSVVCSLWRATELLSSYSYYRSVTPSGIWMRVMREEHSQQDFCHSFFQSLFSESFTKMYRIMQFKLTLEQQLFQQTKEAVER